MWKWKHGSILVYSLIFMLVFVNMMHVYLYGYYELIINEALLAKIDVRLQVESHVIQTFMSDESLEMYDFVMEQQHISCERKGEKIQVIVTGDMLTSFEYVIMEDESLKYSLLEE